MRKVVLRLTVLALAVASGCSGLPGSIHGSRSITAIFDDVGDLVPNHAVQVADVRVGSITKIQLTPDFQAKVTMSLRDGIDIPTDSEAILRQTSLLGEKFIEIRPRDQDHPDRGPYIEDGYEFGPDDVTSAPELEFVAKEAIELLAGVAVNDVETMIQTGAVGFGGREEELRGIIDNLTVINDTLADQSQHIVQIIDGFDRLTSTLAASAPALDQLLANLDGTIAVLADSREEALEAVKQLTRLARVQNEQVFEPFLQDVDRQVKQLDAVLASLDQGQGEVALLLQWLAQFTTKIPKVAPHDFAQVYSLFIVSPVEGG